jgi:hypothetical protein
MYGAVVRNVRTTEQFKYRDIQEKALHATGVLGNDL